MQIISSRQIFEYTVKESPVFKGLEFDGKSLEQKLDPVVILLVVEKGMCFWKHVDCDLRSISFPNIDDAQEYLQSVETFLEIFNGD